MKLRRITAFLKIGQRARRDVLALGLGFCAVSAATPAAAETREFMMKWFIEAANALPENADCPHGLNGSVEDMVRAQLLAVGTPKDEAESLIAGINGGASPPDVREALVYRGRLDGRPMHAYTYPTSVPDLKLWKPNTGPYVFGFNLDGRFDANDYTDPDTNEKGVDNAYWHVAGCQINQRGSRNEVPTYGARHWDLARDKQPAWLVRLEAADFTKDGDVSVYLFRAMERATRDGAGDIRRYWTFRRDPDPRWQNILKGKIKDGVMYAENDKLELLGDPFGVTNFRLRTVRFRGSFNPDGSLEAVLGGYLPWKTLFFQGSSGAYNFEFMAGTNVPALYYALRNGADAAPDPKTGQNSEISTAWRIEGIHAFIVESAQAAGESAAATGKARRQ